MKIEIKNDDTQIIKQVELIKSCLKRAKQFPSNRSHWLSIARNQLTQVLALLDDELEYRNEIHKGVEGNRIKELESHKR